MCQNILCTRIRLSSKSLGLQGGTGKQKLFMVAAINCPAPQMLRIE